MNGFMGVRFTVVIVHDDRLSLSYSKSCLLKEIYVFVMISTPVIRIELNSKYPIVQRSRLYVHNMKINL